MEVSLRLSLLVWAEELLLVLSCYELPPCATALDRSTGDGVVVGHI